MKGATSTKNWRQLGAGLLVGLGVGVILLFGFAWTGRDIGSRINRLVSSPAAKVGREAPDFILTSLNGEVIRLSDYRGKPVLINFWATWCGPCILEMPTIQRYYEELEGEFEVLAINAAEPEFEVRQFVEDIGITFHVLLDPESMSQELYQLRGYPTTYIIDGDGIVRFQHIGQIQKSQLVGYLDQIGLNRGE